MDRALYGPAGFYRRELPVEHFRTAATSDVFADAIARLVEEVDLALDRPPAMQVVDIGAGAGELLTRLAYRLPSRVRLTGVDVRDRPTGLSDRIEWASEAPSRVVGVVLANELLDNVPVDVVQVDDSGALRQVLVDPVSGAESFGGPPRAADKSWLDAWWPLDDSLPGTRAEVGRRRDEAWAGWTEVLTAGLALAIDYSHDRGTRPAAGSLVGYRCGRDVPPVPDGSCDLTAHVALDACADRLVRRRPGDVVALARQRDALRALGVEAHRPSAVGDDPAAYVRGLARASEAGWLTALGGLGDFGWLALARETPMPECLRESLVAR
jgi:SAM-dependent MidA family methyltransferase